MLRVAVDCWDIRITIGQRSEIQGKNIFREILGEHVGMKRDLLDPGCKSFCAHDFLSSSYSSNGCPVALASFSTAEITASSTTLRQFAVSLARALSSAVNESVAVARFNTGPRRASATARSCSRFTADSRKK